MKRFFDGLDLSFVASRRRAEREYGIKGALVDNFVANAGSGGSTFAAKDNSGVLIPRLIPVHSTGNADAALATPLPVGASQESNQMLIGGAVCTPKFAIISVNTNGNNTLVAAVTSKKIRVVSLWINSASTVNALFQSGASGTNLSGSVYLAPNTGMVLPFNPVGWFETAAGVLLNMTLNGAFFVAGSLTYIEV